MDFIKIMIVDDHVMIRQGLRKMLETEKDLVVVGEASNGAEALPLAMKEHPDVVLMDINMPEMNGLEATRQLISKKPQLGIIMLTVYDDDEYVLEAIKSGAIGYLLKDVGSERLITAVRKASTGESLIDPAVATRLLNEMVRSSSNKTESAAGESLTDREREILEIIAGGLSNKEIADKLSISERTVKNHITSIFKKIDVHDRTQAAIFAIREGLAPLK